MEQFANLVSIDWLNQNLNDENILILDATMKKKANGDSIDTPSEIIPGAKVFNFETEICDHNSEFPHMLCSPQDFETRVRALGISADTVIVVYDAMGIFSSPRVWWMFKVMGHQYIYVLNGGLPKWLQAGNPTVKEYANSSPSLAGNFKSNFSASSVYSAQQVLSATNNHCFQILDARTTARFLGREPEPRKGLTGGHIPKSFCLPYSDLLVNGCLREMEELRLIFNSIIDTKVKQLIFSCGSGVTSCLLALAASECGYKDSILYDGSWCEWGASDILPIEI